jgi:hypothetical protein
MKKLLFTLLLLVVAMSANADGLGRLARKYKKYDGAVYAASIDELDKLKGNSNASVTAKAEAEEDDGIKRIVDKMKRSGVRDMRVLSLNDCKFKVKARFATDVDDAVPSAYEGFLNFDRNDGRFSIYIQKRDGYIKLLLVMTGDDNCGFVEIESDNEILNSLLNFD